MTITLYAGVKVSIERNISVDDIEDYLATIPGSDVLVETSQNYFKQKLNTSILLELTQESLNYSYKRYNYCRIQNGTDHAVYYFITNREWRSQTVVALTLLMDTISTLGYLDLTNKTLIHREHKNRFYIKNNVVYPKIDKVAEGISPVLYKSNEQKLIDRANMKWYLVYITNNPINPTDFVDVNPIQKFITSEYGGNAKVGGDFSTTYNIYTDGLYCLFSSQTLGTNCIELRIDGNSYSIKKEKNPLGVMYTYLIIHRVGTTLNYAIKYYLVKYDGTITNGTSTSGTATTIAFWKVPKYLGYYGDSTEPATPLYDKNNYFTTPTSEEGVFKGLRDLDLTDSKIVKVIELPYAPLSYTLDSYGEEFTFEQNIALDSTTQLLKLRYPKLDEEYLIGDITFNSTNCFKYVKAMFASLNGTLYRSAPYARTHEPKLYSSEFYLPKFIYDSFNKEFNLENINLEGFNYSSFRLLQKASENIANDFLFDFTKQVEYTSSLEDYEYILPIKRNNEVAIYSSNYLNYMRTGYNYDEKARATKDIFRQIGVGLGIVKGAVNGGAEGGFAGAMAGGLSSMASTMPSAIEQTILESNSREKMQAQLRAQATTFSTTDDLSLLKYYADNDSAKTAEYTPSEVMQDNLLKLFHFSGYTCEYLGVPSLNTRNRFNYIKADIDIDESKIDFLTKNYPNEVFNDYKSRFALGLTIIHYYNNTYDFEQQYENWETILESKLQ